MAISQKRKENNCLSEIALQNGKFQDSNMNNKNGSCLVRKQLIQSQPGRNRLNQCILWFAERKIAVISDWHTRHGERGQPSCFYILLIIT
jgi:hypothetical protein